MNITKGLAIDNSNTVIPWSIRPRRLAEIVGGDALSEVTRGYYVTQCSVLGGLQISVGFHFHYGRLAEFELFRRFAMPLEESYADFQQHLESTFGPPHDCWADDGGFNHCTWRFGWLFGRASVRHFVMDRFGPEEHVRIGK